jgi:hypothetical protein
MVVHFLEVVHHIVFSAAPHPLRSSHPSLCLLLPSHRHYTTAYEQGPGGEADIEQIGEQ